MYTPQLIEVDPMRIKFNPKNPRKHQGGEFDRLKQSVKEVGVVQLPTVRVLPGGFYEVIDGEGRVRSAQEARLKSIWAVSLGQVSEDDALTMMQSANSVREFGFLAECRGMANMHRQGATAEAIAKKMGLTTPVASHHIAIGYFPDDLLEKMQDASQSTNSVDQREGSISWGHRTIREFLPLRQVPPGVRDPQRSSDIEAYNYSEVRRAIEKTIRGELTSQEQIRAYVEQRRRELFEQRFDKDLQERLKDELSAAKLALEESHQQALQALEQQSKEQFTAQVDAFQKQYDLLQHNYQELVAKTAKLPEQLKLLQEQAEAKLAKAEEERRRFQALQSQVKLEAQKAQQEAERAAQDKMRQMLKERQAAMDETLKQTRADLEAFYSQKDRERQLQAEKSVRQAVAHGTELLTQTQQWILNLTSQGMVRGLSWLPDAEVNSLVAQINAVRDTLEVAAEKIEHNSPIDEERSILNGRQ